MKIEIKNGNKVRDRALRRSLVASHAAAARSRQNLPIRRSAFDVLFSAFSNLASHQAANRPALSPLTTDHGQLTTIKTRHTQYATRNSNAASHCCSTTTDYRPRMDTNGHECPHQFSKK
jgi:hypothetical protein